MSVLAKCPQCGHQFGVPDKYAGKRGKCPECGHLFRAPTLEEDIADWGNEVESVAPPLAASPPPVDTAPPVAKLAGRPKAPLPKMLSEVTPPPVPVAPEAVANTPLPEADLPDLASLSEPAGPMSGAPAVAPLARPVEDLPDLSSISEDPIPVAKPAAPSAPVARARPTAPIPAAPADTPSSSGKKPAAPADAVGPVIDTGPPIGAGPTRKRRASDVFDPQELAAQLGVAETQPAKKTPNSQPPQISTKAAAPSDRPAAAKPASGKPTAKTTPKPATKPAAAAPQPTGARRAKPLPTAEPLKTATPATKPPAKKSADKAADSAPKPQAKEQPPSEAAALAAAIATEGEVGTRPAAGKGRKKSAKTPWLLIGVGGALAAVVLLIVGGLAVSSLLSPGEAEVTDNGETELPGEEVAIIRDAEGGGSAAGTATSAELSAPQWDSARQAVVRLEVLTGDSKEIGTGFLIEPQGWVATTYSLIQHGTSASVVTYRGRHLVEGTVAANPELDLAILKIESLGENADLPMLPLYEGPNRIAKQTAYVCRDYFNSRLDSSRGVAERSLPMAELRPSLRPRLTERARDNGLLNFIEIDGRVTGTAHGGPLVNAKGQVLGVCIYLGDSSRFSYAIHGKHLVELKASAGNEVKPLAPDPLARSDQPDRPGSVVDKDDTDGNGADASGAGGTDSGRNDDPEIAEKKDPLDEPFEGPSEPSAPDDTAVTPPPADDPFAEPNEITAEKLQETLDVCEELRFVVATEEEYAKLQDLAFLLTKVQEMADDESVPEERRGKLSETAEKVTNHLANLPWVDVASTNKLAVTALANPHRGTFMYATTMASQPDIAQLDGRNVILFQLVDNDRLVVMPTKAEVDQFPRGSRWLIVGIHNPHPTITFKMPDGRTAEYIDAKYVIGEPKD